MASLFLRGVLNSFQNLLPTWATRHFCSSSTLAGCVVESVCTCSGGTYHARTLVKGLLPSKKPLLPALDHLTCMGTLPYLLHCFPGTPPFWILVNPSPVIYLIVMGADNVSLIFPYNSSIPQQYIYMEREKGKWNDREIRPKVTYILREVFILMTYAWREIKGKN